MKKRIKIPVIVTWRSGADLITMLPTGLLTSGALPYDAHTQLNMLNDAVDNHLYRQLQTHLDQAPFHFGR